MYGIPYFFNINCLCFEYAVFFYNKYEIAHCPPVSFKIEWLFCKDLVHSADVISWTSNILVCKLLIYKYSIKKIVNPGDSSSSHCRLSAYDVGCHQALCTPTAAWEGVGKCGHSTE